jgi:hypothetical protein
VVDGDEPPPPELRMAWLCERYNALPDGGGLLDQDAGLMTRMGAANNVYRALHHYRTAVGKQSHSLTDGERDIVKMLMDRKLIYG